MKQSKDAQTNDTTDKTILGLIIFVILLIVGIIILKFIWESITEDPTITVAIITGFVSIVVIIIQRIWEKNTIMNKKLEKRSYQFIRRL